jgi:hypothetical protein
LMRSANRRHCAPHAHRFIANRAAGTASAACLANVVAKGGATRPGEEHAAEHAQPIAQHPLRARALMPPAPRGGSHQELTCTVADTADASARPTPTPRSIACERARARSARTPHTRFNGRRPDLGAEDAPQVAAHRLSCVPHLWARAIEHTVPRRASGQSGGAGDGTWKVR